MFFDKNKKGSFHFAMFALNNFLVVKNFIMKTNFILLGMFVTVLMNYTPISAQIFLDLGEVICDDKNTENDPSDDEFSFDLFVGKNNDSVTTWSSSDELYSTQDYDTQVSFGPYLIAGGDVSIEITDDNDDSVSSSITVAAPEPCSFTPVECPEWTNCVRVLESDGCTHLLQIFFTGNGMSGVNFLRLKFGITQGNGKITSAGFITQTSSIMANGGSIDISEDQQSLFITRSNGPGFEIADFSIESVLVYIQGEVEDCFYFGREIPHVILIENATGPCFPSSECEPIQVCSDGSAINGLVTSSATSCEGTQNLGIDGATVSISSATEECSSTTGNDGTFECEFCDEGPYEVCVNTKCEEPCGITPYDILILKRMILGLERKTRNFLFAGDINNDGRSNVRDLITMQRYLLRLEEGTEINWEEYNKALGIDSWCRFVPVKDMEDINPNGTNDASILNQIDNCITVTDPNEPIEFKRYMLGDVDGSCSDCGGEKDEEIENTPLVINDNEPNFLQFVLPADLRMHALAIDLDIPEGSKILEVESDLPNLLSSKQISEKGFRIIWLDYDSKGIETNSISNVLKIRYMGEAPVLRKNGNLLLTHKKGITKLISDKISTRNHEGATLSVGGLATFDLQIDGEAKVNVDIFDIFGRLCVQKSVDIRTSTNVDVEALPSKGIYIIHVYNDHNNISKKVLYGS